MMNNKRLLALTLTLALGMSTATAMAAEAEESAPLSEEAFNDVPEGHWAYSALEVLSKDGVLEGYPDGSFKGDEPMTRYELTRMEGIIPAIESAHAVAALKKMKFKKDDVVVLTVSGRGDKDVETYLSHKEMAGEYGNF